MFNPKVSEFLAEHKDITIIGLYWAGYWRFVVAIYGIIIIGAVIIGILGSLFK